jgi:hypothetical protein
MVVSLRCKTCDHFSTKQGYFFRISGTLDLVTGGQGERSAVEFDQALYDRQTERSIYRLTRARIMRARKAVNPGDLMVVAHAPLWAAISGLLFSMTASSNSS